jgi:hypothetical protein
MPPPLSIFHLLTTDSLGVFVPLTPIKGQVATFSVPKILNLYTPADEFEERVSPSFVRKIQTKLQVSNTV